MTRYIIRKIRLTNFLSHRDTLVEFDRGSTGIVGENGAGKSSILEAIYFALTGQGFRTGHTTRNLVSHGSSTARVLLELESLDGGKKLEAIASVPGSEGYILKVNGRLAAKGKKPYLTLLYQELGISELPSPDDFLARAVIVRQGGLREAADRLANPRRMKEEIEAAIGLPEIRRFTEKLEKTALTLEDGQYQALVKPGPMHIRRLRERMEEARSKRRRLQEEAGRVEEEAKRLERVEEELRERIAGLEEELARVGDAEERLKSELARLREIEEEAERLGKLLKSEEARAKRLEEELERYKAYAEKLEAEEHVYKARRLLAEIRELEYEARLLEEALGDLKQAGKLREQAGRLGETREKLREARERLEIVQKRLAEVEAVLREAESRRLSLEREINSIYGALTRILPVKPESLEDARSLLEELELELLDVRGKLDESRREIARLEGLLREKEKALEALKAGSGDHCPVCGSRLSPERVQELIEKLEKEREAYGKTLRELRELLEKLEREEKRLSSRVEQGWRLVDKLADRLRQLDSLPDTDSLQEERARLRKRLEEFRREVGELERTVERLQRLEEEAKTLEAGARRRLGDLTPARAEERLRELQELLEEKRAIMAGELEAVRSILGPVSLDTAMEILDDARRRQREARRLEDELAGLRASIAEKRGRLQGLLEEAEGRKRLVGELEARARQAAEARKRLDEARRLREDALRRLSEARASAERLREQARELEALEKLYDRALALSMAARAAVNIFRELEGRLYDRGRRAIEDEASRILDSFNLDPQRLVLDDEKGGYVITRSGRETPITLLSGGEKTALALSYILALNRLMASGIGFLALDEPTSELDDERRRKLMELIGGMAQGEGRVVDQLIVVTHHDEVADSVDALCRVSKRQGYSRVEGCKG